MVGLGERTLNTPGQKNRKFSKTRVSGLHSTVQIFIIFFIHDPPPPLKKNKNMKGGNNDEFS
nr:MAG TPA: hypothetical protein [Caudoviricetes sp.]